MRVGRQTLAVFLSGLVLAQLMGVALALRGDGPLMQIAVNLGGSLGLYAVALTVEYFKGAGKRTSPPSTHGKGGTVARAPNVGAAPLEQTATHEAATLV